jgi:hypothetical protein
MESDPKRAEKTRKAFVKQLHEASMRGMPWTQEQCDKLWLSTGLLGPAPLVPDVPSTVPRMEIVD